MYTTLMNPNDVPTDVLRSVISLTCDQRELIRAFLECSDDLQRVVMSMFAVLDSREATEEERYRARTTIADALFLNPHNKRYGMDVIGSETEAAAVTAALATEVGRMNREEAAFAERLRVILDRKHMTQSELAERTGCSQSAISHMLNRQARPQKKTILKLAEALQVEPIELWPDLEVAEILDAVASFQEDHELTPTQANSLREALDCPATGVQARRLPSRPRSR